MVTNYIYKILVFLLCFTILPTALAIDYDFSNITYQDTDNNDFYEINNCNELQGILNHSNSTTNNYELSQDIDCNNFDYGDGQGFMPIIDSNYDPFQGNFNGNRYTISNLYINRTSNSWYLGLFEEIENSNFKDLSLKNISISGNDDMGSIAGFIENSNFTNINISGIINSERGQIGTIGSETRDSNFTNITIHININGNETQSYRIGGITGESYNDIFRNIHINSNILGSDEIGGVSGDSYRSSYENIFFKGNILGEDDIGGIVGDSSRDTFEDIKVNANISGVNSYSDYMGGIAGYSFWSQFSNISYEGNIIGEDEIGGIVGSGSNNIISNSTTSGKIDGELELGGFIGLSFRNNSIINSQADMNIQGVSILGGMIGFEKYNTSSIISSNFNGVINASINSYFDETIGYVNPYNINISIYRANESVNETLVVILESKTPEKFQLCDYELELEDDWDREYIEVEDFNVSNYTNYKPLIITYNSSKNLTEVDFDCSYSIPLNSTQNYYVGFSEFLDWDELTTYKYNLNQFGPTEIELEGALEKSIKSKLFPTVNDKLISNIPLITNLFNEENIFMTWKSSNSSLIQINSSLGIVNRSSTEENVTLKLILSKKNSSINKTFNFTLKEFKDLNLTDESGIVFNSTQKKVDVNETFNDDELIFDKEDLKNISFINISKPENQTITLNLKSSSQNNSVNISENNLSVDRESTNIIFEKGTIIRGSNWAGDIILPSQRNTINKTAPNVSGKVTNISNVIKVGSDYTALNLSKAVKITFKKDSGKSVAYSNNGTIFTKITMMCNSATNSSNITGNGECYFDDGSNLIIWTKHFTEFATFTETELQEEDNSDSSSTDSSTSSSSGGGGGGGSSSSSAVTSIATGNSVKALSSEMQNDFSISIDSNSNIEKSYTGEKNIEITSKNIELLKVEFNHNFNKQLDLSSLEIQNGTINNKSYAIISGISLDLDEVKTVTIPTNNNVKSVCIRDEEISSISEVTQSCSGDNEYIVTCNGDDVNEYRCELGEDFIRVSGLQHSGIMEFEIGQEIVNSSNNNEAMINDTDINEINNNLNQTSENESGVDELNPEPAESSLSNNYIWFIIVVLIIIVGSIYLLINRKNKED